MSVDGLRRLARSLPEGAPMGHLDSRVRGTIFSPLATSGASW